MLALGHLGPAAAQETGDDAFDFGDDEAFDFGDDPAADPVVLEPSRPYTLSLGGFLRSDWGLWLERFDEDPFAKGRQSVDLALRFRWSWLRILMAGHLEYDVAWLVDRGRWDDATLDAYWWRFDSRELLVAFSFDMVELTFGRQIVLWGAGTMLSPLDVVNPRDAREPGLTDLEDLRLPVLTTQLGLFFGDHRIELMVVHENSYGYRSPPRGPFSPFAVVVPPEFDALVGDRSLFYDDRQPRFSLEGQQAFLRWSYSGPGLDLGVYAASLIDRQGLFAPPDMDALLAFLPYLMDSRLPLPEGEVVPELVHTLRDPTAPLGIELDHHRYHLVGTSGAAPIDDWVIRWEARFDIDLPVNTGDASDFLNMGMGTSHLLNLMVGTSFSGIPDTVLTLELQKGIPIGAPADLSFPLDALGVAFGAQTRLLKETLDLSVALMALTWLEEDVIEGAWILRADASYLLMDGMRVTLGLITYQPGDGFSPFAGLDRHDRLFLKWRYDFAVP